MRHLLLELRDSARSLRRDRGFSATVILTLAITIGATTAAFSIVNGILLKPLAYPEPDRLVTLREVWREVPASAAGFPVNQRHFEHLRRHSTLFEAMTQFITLPANLTSGGPATQISVAAGISPRACASCVSSRTSTARASASRVRARRDGSCRWPRSRHGLRS